ncbi:MAG TPA: VOC family protein [Nitrospiraceae bacterium]|nr:VOC family protein [Nitrospiraceae bacterium]
MKLAIWPRTSLAHEAKVPLGPRSATECTLGHNVASKAEVDAVMAQVKKAGATITDPPHDAFWGGYTGSFQDPDGHVWEVAWNPDWEIPD